jgi:predicted MFS family arabinose efflux permease
VAQNKKKLTALQSVWAVLADPRSWAFLILYIMNSTSTSISYFVPVTLRTMGYTSVTAQWMTVPIWLSGAIIMIIISTSSDYFRDRRWHTGGALAIAFICSVVCLTTAAGAVRYAMLCLYIGGLYTAIAQILNGESCKDPHRTSQTILQVSLNVLGALSLTVIGESLLTVGVVSNLRSMS